MPEQKEIGESPVAESRARLLEFISEQGLVTFDQIDELISSEGLTYGSGFVVDNDPIHPEPHPLDEFVSLQEKLGKLVIDMEAKTIRLPQPA